MDQYYNLSKASMPEREKAMTPAARAKTKCVCPVCNGKETRRASDELVARSRSELMQYVAPKRKAVEHTGDLLVKTHEEKLAELMS